MSFRFFAPSIVNLEKENKLYLLCLSTGNYDNIGETRFEEMKKAAKFFRFKDLRILDEDEIQDGPWTWSSVVVGNKIEKYIKDLRKNKKVKIDTIVTFDD